jgi:hypothetical protein
MGIPTTRPPLRRQILGIRQYSGDWSDEAFCRFLEEQIPEYQRTPGVRLLIDYAIALRCAGDYAADKMCTAAGVPDDGSHPLSDAMVFLRQLTR